MSHFPDKLGRLSRCEHIDFIVHFTTTDAVSATASYKQATTSHEQK